MISLLQTKLLLLVGLGYAGLVIGMSATHGAGGFMRAVLYILLANFVMRAILSGLLACRKPRRPTPGDPRDDYTNDERLGFVLCTGTGSSPLQALKYARRLEYTPTGEDFSSSCVPVMTKFVYATRGTEIILTGFLDPLQTLVPTYLATYFKMWQRGVHRETPFTFRASLTESRLDLNGLNLGLSGDAHEAYSQFSQAVARHDSVVLWGFSKGCSALVHALPTMRKHPQWARVKGIVLEAPFDQLARVETGGAMCRLLILGARIFGGLDVDNNNPLAQLERVKGELPPVLVIASKSDEVVPFEGAEAYGKALAGSIEEGKAARCEMLILEASSHDGLRFDNEADAKLYTHGVHDFLEKAGLPSLKAAARVAE